MFDNNVAAQEIITKLLARANENVIVPRLEPLRQVMDLLGQPQTSYPMIHITGTNGKTSTARMIDSLLRAYNLRTGLYTSPHLEEVFERICVDGKPVSAEVFVETWNNLENYIKIVEEKLLTENQSPFSFFEIMTIMAYLIFAEAPVDVAVVEVGLGGTWDATNIANGVVSVFTPIALDHQDYLGNTISEIAIEKVGILKEEAIGVVAQQDIEVVNIISQKAAQLGAKLLFENVDFKIMNRTAAVGGQMVDICGTAGTYNELFVPLLGEHQGQNAALALVAVEAFLGGGNQALDGELLAEAFGVVESAGRLEVLRSAPTILVDAAHNRFGAEVLVKALKENFNFSFLVGIVGVLADKDAFGILEELETVLDTVIIAAPVSERAFDVMQLRKLAVEVFGEERVLFGKHLDVSIEMAVELVEQSEDFSGGILIVGSIRLVAEAKTLLGSK